MRAGELRDPQRPESPINLFHPPELLHPVLHYFRPVAHLAKVRVDPPHELGASVPELASHGELGTLARPGPSSGGAWRSRCV